MPPIKMPQLGESVTEGTIGRWLKKPGDRIERDEPIVEIITDKVNAEIPSPSAGVLRRINADEGAVIAVGQEIAYLATDGDEPASAAGDAATATAAEPAGRTGEAEEGEGDQPRTSPLVRRLAKEHGLDLRQITGSGLSGRVTREDVEAFLRERPAAAEVRAAAVARSAEAPPGASEAARPAAPESATAPPSTSQSRGGAERITPTPMRRTIAQRMAQSAREIPAAWLMVEADVTGLVRLRDSLKEAFRRDEGVDLTYLPFFMKATVDALREHPIVNASWQDDSILLKHEINLGVAVALESGLIVPVIRDSAHKNVVGLAHALHDVVARARTGRLTVADVDGGTFTVNNTGAFGSIASQPIINYPQAGILTLEAIVKRAVVTDEAISIRSMVNLCFTFDHRVLDGLTAGRFLQSVKRTLESWGPGSSL